MTAKDLTNNLNELGHSDLVRFLFDCNKNTLSLLVVGDSEEEEKTIKPKVDPEYGDEQEEYRNPEEEDTDCDSGMNGHLFRLDFQGVSSFKQEGEECDSYTIREVRSEENKLSLLYEGTNLAGDNQPLSLSFSYESYSVVDRGKIEGPDA
ncbi:MAG: hypothetical protein WCR16_04910 [Bacilli bacterium]|jgi:hypothetical protein